MYDRNMGNTCTHDSLRVKKQSFLFKIDKGEENQVSLLLSVFNYFPNEFQFRERRKFF